MSKISMYSSKDKEEFWATLEGFIASKNEDYVDVSATSRLCIKNISFTRLTTDEVDNCLLRIQDRYRDELRFENCEFIDANFSCFRAKNFFISCQFKGNNNFSFSKEVDIKKCNFYGTNVFEVNNGVSFNLSDCSGIVNLAT